MTEVNEATRVTKVTEVKRSERLKNQGKRRSWVGRSNRAKERERQGGYQQMFRLV